MVATTTDANTDAAEVEVAVVVTPELGQVLSACPPIGVEWHLPGPSDQFLGQLASTASHAGHTEVKGIDTVHEERAETQMA